MINGGKVVGCGSKYLSEAGSRVKRKRRTEFVEMGIDNNAKIVDNASQLHKTYAPNYLVSG